jgi:putative hydrolase of the HAD superfamily
VPLLNVVFDLGGVVFNWQPDSIIGGIFTESRTQKLVREEIIDHPDWIELDRGTLSVEDAIIRGASRTGLSYADIEKLFNAVPPSLTPIPGTIDLMRSITDTTNRLFVLSNMQSASISYLETNHKIWDLFDGVVISSRVNKVKPEIAIYEHLLKTYKLEAGETVFIDDMSENLVAAASIGIRTVKFVDPYDCRQRLVDLKCIR